MKVAIVGCTGMVGNIILDVLAERSFPLSDLIMVASQKSVGKNIFWQEKEYEVQSLEDAIVKSPTWHCFLLVELAL